MSYLIGFHWAWLLAALILGVIMGWLTYQQRRTRWMDGLVWLAAMLLAVAAIIAISTTVLGLPGYLLEIAVLLVVAYVVGCPLGWALRRLAFVDLVSADDDCMIPKPGYTFPGHAVELGSQLGVRAGGVDEAGSSTAVAPEPIVSTGAAAATSQAGPETIKSEPSQAPVTNVPVPFDAKPAEPARSGPAAAPSSTILPPAPVESLNVAKREDASATADGTSSATDPSQGETLPQAVAATGSLGLESFGPTATPKPTEPTRAEPTPTEPAPTSASDKQAPPPSGSSLVKETAESPELPLFRSSGSQAANLTSPTPSMAGAQIDSAPTTPAGPGPGPSAPETTSVTATTTGSASATFAAQGSATQVSGTEQAPPTPEKMAALPDEHRHAGSRPDGWIAARDNTPDDLKRIKGIGPQNEGRLHGLGIWHFDQIAAWTPDNVKWVGSYLAFHGRIEREKWIDQAKVLASGQGTEFSKRVAAGKVATSLDDGSMGQANTGPVTKPGPRKR